jgi:branched-subunit amino acid transport protein AzlD
MDEICYPKELRRALAGEYSFTTNEILSAGYLASNGFKGTTWVAIGIISTISIIIGIFTELARDNQIVALLGDTLGALIIQPMNAGLVMLGVLYTSGKTVRPQQVMDYYERALKIVLLQVLVVIGTLLGLCLLILPGIYFMVGCSLARVLMLKYDLGIRESIRLSIRIVRHEWFRFFGLYIAMGLIIVVSAIPLDIGLIWTIPMGICGYGKLFNSVIHEANTERLQGGY